MRRNDIPSNGTIAPGKAAKQFETDMNNAASSPPSSKLPTHDNGHIHHVLTHFEYSQMVDNTLRGVLTSLE